MRFARWLDDNGLDFAAILLILTLLTGLIWAIDRLFFARRRAVRAAQVEASGAGASEERTALVEKTRREPLLVEYSRSFFPVILIVLLFRSFLAEPFRIPSSSMMPTLLIGDFILVNKFSYGIRLPVWNKKVLALGEPQRGDIIVFRFPQDPTVDYIKRVIGVPGDEVVYRNKTVYVNGEELPQSQLGAYIGVGSGADMTGAERRVERLPGMEHEILHLPRPMREGTWRVGEGEYFVLGDNRDNSQDSRFWGMVPERNLVGKAFLIWMNFDGNNGGIEFGRIGTLIK